MNKILFLVCASSMMTLGANAQTKKTPVKKNTPATSTVMMKNANDSFSYAAGMNIAASMKEQGITKLNTAMVQKAIQDVFDNKKLSLTQEQANMTLQQQLQEYAMKKVNAEKAKGMAFLTANKARSGVKTLPSGLQYEIIKAGEANGAKPTAVDSVEVHYAGRTIDGTEDFDNSYKRGAPVKFKLNEVIPGWTEIVQQMTKGAHWKVYIPSELGYGERGNGAIPPGATLIFDIELLGIYPVAK